MKKTLSRRDALRGMATVSAAALVGCPDDTQPLPNDASVPPSDAAASDALVTPDAGRDGGPGWDAGPAPTGAFQHGVASGDPHADSVILWTRVSEQSAAVSVMWEVSTSSGFESLTASGAFDTDASRDHTVKLEAAGLSPGATYFYRFRLGSAVSPIGRTRTAPSGATDRLRFAVCSCASYAHGYFHGYRRIAERADLDAVVHLGDYIYEYGSGEYGRVREYDPPHEILTLDDYRRRYRHYRLDRDLQEAHRQHPFITTWDDHESANDASATGAENHKPTEGAWAARLSAASQAYREWMPFRESLEGDRLRLYRTLRYGELVDLIVLDTRIWARDAQAANAADPSLTSETRTLLGGDQESWLFDQIRTSTARWKVLCQQVMVTQLPLFLNTDAWDGYPAQRRRLFSFLADDAGTSHDDVVVLTGDIHTSWASDLTPTPTDASTYTPGTGAGSLAVEFVCPGITSPGAGMALEDILRPRLPTDGPQIKYFDLWQRGYVVLDLDATRAQAAWFHVADVSSIAGSAESFSAAWHTETGANHVLESESAAAPRTDAPPLAPG